MTDTSPVRTLRKLKRLIFRLECLEHDFSSTFSRKNLCLERSYVETAVKMLKAAEASFNKRRKNSHGEN